MKELLSNFAEASISRGDIGLTGPTSDSGVLDGVLGAVYFWAGIVAVGLIIFSGFMYVTSTGDPGKAIKAKNAIIYSIVGLVVVMLAFAITKFVIGGVNGS